jgi:hypothetical protein
MQTHAVRNSIKTIPGLILLVQNTVPNKTNGQGTQCYVFLFKLIKSLFQFLNTTNEMCCSRTLVLLRIFSCLISHLFIFKPIEGVKNFLSFKSSRMALGSTQHPIQWVPGALSPGVKRSGREADHLPPDRTEVRKIWIYTSTTPYAFMAWCLIS